MKKKILGFLGLLLFVININSVSADWAGRMTPTELNLKVGEKSTVKAVQTGEEVINTLPTYISSDPSVVEVDINGNVEAKKVGTATITGKFGSFTAGTTKVTVSGTSEQWSGRMTPTELNLLVNGTGKVTAEQTGTFKLKTLPTYTSSNPSVATVDSNGNVKALKVGTTTITGKYDDSHVAGTTKVTVNVEGWSAEVTPKELNLKIGGTGKISAKQTGSAQVNTLPTYTNSDNSIATVDSNGNVKALKVGSTIVTVKYGNLVAGTSKVTVTDNGEIWSGEVNPTKLKLAVGGTSKVTATQTGTYKIKTVATYTSSDSSVATVDKDGNVKALKVGKATITARFGSYIAGTVTVTVYDKTSSETETIGTTDDEYETIGTTDDEYETIGTTTDDGNKEVTEEQNEPESNVQKKDNNIILYIIIAAGALLVVSCAVVIIGKFKNKVD